MRDDSLISLTERHHKVIFKDGNPSRYKSRCFFSGYLFLQHNSDSPNFLTSESKHDHIPDEKQENDQELEQIFTLKKQI